MKHIYIGADHRGYQLKASLIEWLKQEGYQVTDCGNSELDQHDDYPQFSFAVGEAVAADPSAAGVVICGSGAGAVIAANKVPGVRAILSDNPNLIISARNDDNSNVLCLGADYVTQLEAQELVSSFITTEFGQEERFKRRLAQISEYERKHDK